MSYLMTSEEFIEKAKDIAKNYKTLYVMGCFGAPLNDKNKVRYLNNHSYNKVPARQTMIKNASDDTFGFDCVCLIKGILWGWTANTGHVYGGAKYASNNVPDLNANSMILKCTDISTDFSNIVEGEAVWMDGHIGIYVGDGLAVECTPSWDNCVQITAVANVGTKKGYHARKWTKHGKLPWIKYCKAVESSTYIEPAKSKDDNLAGRYIIKASALNLRAGAGTSKPTVWMMRENSKFICYGYFTMVNGVIWLYGEYNDGKNKHVGFASSKYLEKVKSLKPSKVTKEIVRTMV